MASTDGSRNRAAPVETMSKPVVALDARLVGGSSTGDSTYWTGLLHGLARVSSEFRFLLFSNAPRPPGIPDFFEWVHLPAFSPRWWSLVSFPLAVRKAGADLVHVQYSLSPLVRNGITTVHDVSFLIGPEWFPARHRLLLQKTVPASIHRALRVITVSNTSKAEIESKIPLALGKTRVTPLAGHPEVHPKPREESLAWVRNKLGVNDPFLLSVSTRWPRKNMQLAIDAVAQLREPAPQLVLTGKAGWGDERMTDRVVATGYVDFEALSYLYSAAELYLAPSRHEGFGLPIVEAFTCGCPVLASSGGALPETVGEAGVIEPSWQASDWSASIERLLGDSSNLDELRKRGLERATKFTWEETARKTLEVYREALTSSIPSSSRS